MDRNNPEWTLELEEGAEGVELFQPPGSELQLEKSADQAEASGWIPEQQQPAPPRSSIDVARHRRAGLRRAMLDMETAAARPATAEGWTRQVEVTARCVATALSKHVRDVESREGLLAEVGREAPRLESQVEAMRREHVTLTRSARSLIDQLGLRPLPDPSDLRRTVLSLLGELALHRQHGADLVYDAYNIDIGAAD